MLEEEGKLDHEERDVLEMLNADYESQDYFALFAFMNNLALQLQDAGRVEEAEGLLRGVLYGTCETYGDTDLSTLATMSNLGLLLKDTGKLQEAEVLLRQVLDIRKEMYGIKGGVDVLNAEGNLGLLLMSMGDQEGAQTVKRTVESLQGPPYNLPSSDPWIVKFEDGLKAKRSDKKTLVVDPSH